MTFRDVIQSLALTNGAPHIDQEAVDMLNNHMPGDMRIELGWDLDRECSERLHDSIRRSMNRHWDEGVRDALRRQRESQ